MGFLIHGPGKRPKACFDLTAADQKAAQRRSSDVVGHLWTMDGPAEGEFGWSAMLGFVPAPNIPSSRPREWENACRPHRNGAGSVPPHRKLPGLHALWGPPLTTHPDNRRRGGCSFGSSNSGVRRRPASPRLPRHLASIETRDCPPGPLGTNRPSLYGCRLVLASWAYELRRRVRPVRLRIPPGSASPY